MPRHDVNKKTTRCLFRRLAFASRHFTGKSGYFIAFLGCVPWLPGCVESRMQRNLAESAAVQRKEFASLIDKAMRAPAVGIGWDDAYRRMMADNLSLRQSANQLEQARRSTRDQWISLAPNFAIFANLGDSLSSVTDFGSDNISLNLVGNLNIPNPFDFHARLYAAALQKQNAEWSHQLDKRRAFIELHQVFSDQARLDEMEKSLRVRQLNLSPDQKDPVRQLEGMRNEQRNLERIHSAQRVRINHLLNTPGANWRLTGSPPRISYRDRIDQLRIGENFGKLAMNLQAIQIEGAILRRQRVKFQQWPMISFGLSAPPLWSNQDQTSLSSDNLYFFSGAARSINLADPIGRQDLRDAEERIQFTRAQLRLRIETESHQLLQARKTYHELLAEERQLKKSLQRIESSRSIEAVFLLADLAERAQVVSRLGEVQGRILQLDLQLLIWDETFWK